MFMKRIQVMRPTLLCAYDGCRNLTDPQHKELLCAITKAREKSLSRVGMEPTTLGID